MPSGLNPCSRTAVGKRLRNTASAMQKPAAEARETPPCHGAVNLSAPGTAADESFPAANRLLQRLLDAGLSRWEPDPEAALAPSATPRGEDSEPTRLRPKQAPQSTQRYLHRAAARTAGSGSFLSCWIVIRWKVPRLEQPIRWRVESLSAGRGWRLLSEFHHDCQVSTR